MGCDVFQKLRIISKIADYAFEISMTIGLILQQELSESQRAGQRAAGGRAQCKQPRCFVKANSHFRMHRNFCKTRAGPRGGEKKLFLKG